VAQDFASTKPVMNVKMGPQAKDDFASGDEGTVISIDALDNDLGGAAKTFWSLDQSDPSVQTAFGTHIELASGAFVWFENGQIQYDAGSIYDYLGKDETATDTFTYAIRLANGVVSYATVTVTVVGTNTAPVAVADTAITDENTAIAVDVLANDSDPDAGDTISLFSANGPADKGTVSISGNSVYFEPGTDFDHLAAGQSEDVVISYVVSDNHGAHTTSTLTITVNGTNDAPVVSGAVIGTATEDGATVPLDALANASDIDDGAVLSVLAPPSLPAGVTYDGPTHSFVLDPADAAYQSLAAGETTVVTVNYQVSDGTVSVAASAQWTVTGTNDAPVVSGTVTGTATEDGPTSSLVALANASDVDNAAVLAVIVPPTLPSGVTYDALTGSFVIDPADAAYQSLAAGETTVVHVDYGVTDGTATTPAAVEWTVTGTNDIAVITGTATGNVSEDGVLSALGTLAVADVDNGEATFAAPSPAALTGTYGTYTFDTATGGWSYSLDNASAAVQALAAGQTVTDTLAVASYDGTATQDIVVTVTGQNDAPQATPQSTTITEDATPSTFDALASVSDVDTLDTHSVVDVPTTLPDGVTYNPATHEFTLDPSAAVYQALEDGQSTVVTVDYGVSDGTVTTPTSLSWTVTGVNDPPVANPVDAEIAGGSARVNLLLTLDLSGSMTATRLAAAQDALINLISTYDAKGEVAVRLVTFSETSVDVAGHWLTPEEAKAEILAYTPFGTTNYDAALTQAREAFMTGDGRLDDAQNFSYFVSDGQPTLGSTSGPGAGTGINAYEEGVWTSFLNANKINSFAINIAANAVTDLNPIAYNGVTGTNANAVYVPNPSNLSSVLASTVNAAVEGNLLTDASPAGSFGPDDSGYVQSITVLDTTYSLDFGANTITRSGGTRAFSYDAPSHTLTTTDATGGTLSIDMLTGDYAFTPTVSNLGSTSSVGFTLADLFGATSSSVLSLNNDGVRDDHIITNATGTLAIQKSALLANDSDPTGAAISITAVAPGSGAAPTLGATTVNFATGVDPVETFSYTGTSSTGSDTATVTVDHSQAGSSNVAGTAGDDIIVLAAAAGLTVTGGAGNDRIFGSSGTETYVVGTHDGSNIITDPSTGNILHVSGTGDLGALELRLAYPTGTTLANDLLFSIGDTTVAVTGGNLSNVIGTVEFEAGATAYGATLASAYSLSATPGMGLIVKPTNQPNAQSILIEAGSNFDDIVYGGPARDVLHGYAGNDIIIGGDGADTLYGEAGNDTFVFTSPTDGHSDSLSLGGSPVLYDVIMDFTQGEDMISLMAIDADTSVAGDQAFAFGGQTTAVLPHTVTWSRIDADTIMLRADVDGDNVADFQLQINSALPTFSLLASDLHL